MSKADAMRALADKGAGRLRVILIHLGPGFECTRENRIYLSRLLEELQSLFAAVEFHHRNFANVKSGSNED